MDYFATRRVLAVFSGRRYLDRALLDFVFSGELFDAVPGVEQAVRLFRHVVQRLVPAVG